MFSIVYCVDLWVSPATVAGFVNEFAPCVCVCMFLCLCLRLCDIKTVFIHLKVITFISTYSKFFMCSQYNIISLPIIKCHCIWRWWACDVWMYKNPYFIIIAQGEPECFYCCCCFLFNCISSLCSLFYPQFCHSTIYQNIAHSSNFWYVSLLVDHCYRRRRIDSHTHTKLYDILIDNKKR